jgi:regulator of sigma E protease
MTDIVHRSPGEELRVKVRRGGEELVLAITPRSDEGKNVFGEPREIGLIGIRPKGDFFTKRYGPLDAFSGGFEKTYEITHLTLLAFVKLVQRVIPADNLGGPILILSMAGERAAAGLSDYFTFMAVISINLGVLNLFPVPILDGGHILFLAIEAVRGRPLKEKTMVIANKVGLTLLLTLVAFAVYNDIVKMIAGSLVPE